MAVFVERTPERLRSAEQSFAAGDLEATAAALHSLRSASGTVGARSLTELAGRLERAARGDGDLAAGLAELKLEAEQALRAARHLARAVLGS
jgi:HPt (histidine-containing phosphotransfer) domain-containing protein